MPPLLIYNMTDRDRLENKVRACIIIVSEIEENKETKKTKVSFIALDGIYDIKIPAGKDEVVFSEGQRYIGIFDVYCPPDFIGDDPKTMDVGTMSYSLKKIEDLKGNIVYERKKAEK